MRNFFSTTALIALLVLSAQGNSAWADSIAAQKSTTNTVVKDEAFEGCTAKLLDPSFPPDTKTKMSASYVYTWFSFVVPSAVTTSRETLVADMSGAHSYFTDQGWKEFDGFLASIDLKNFLSAEKKINGALVQSFFTTAPHMVKDQSIQNSTNEVLGHVWAFDLELQSTFFVAGQKTEKISHLIIEVLFSNKDNSLKINRWVNYSNKVTPNTAAKDKTFDGCTTKLLDSSFPPDAKTKLSASYVYTWFTLIVPLSSSSAQAFFQKGMEEAREHFTDQGWEEFNKFLSSIDFRNFLFSHDNTSSIKSFFTTAPWLIREGKMNNPYEYTWYFKANLQSTFFEDGDKREKISPLIISVVVSKEDATLKIDHWTIDNSAGGKK